MSATRPRLIVAGGGLAGCLVALALSQRRPDVDFSLIEQGPAFGGNHVWSFFDTDIRPTDRALIGPLIHRSWADHEIRFPDRSRVLNIGYNSIRSAQLDKLVRAQLTPDQYRLDCRIDAIGADHVVAAGERLDATAVIDARGAVSLPGIDLAWQKFVGRTYRFSTPHGLARPIIMDALVDQRDGYRFVYSLPFDERELLIEDTYYSTDPKLDQPALAADLDRRAAMIGDHERLGEEVGVLPIVLGGSIDLLWSSGGAPVPKIGMRGGFFHATTGYSLPDAVRNAAQLCEQSDFGAEALRALFMSRAKTLWKRQRFFHLLNRMLFSVQPRERYRILQHFYRLPESIIARFYAAELTGFDKLRILSGRPPIPLRNAFSALTGRSA